MDLYKFIKSNIVDITTKLIEEKGVEEFNYKLLDRIAVEPPKDSKHGDMSSNVAMVIAKQLKLPPREIAEEIANKVNDIEDVSNVNIAGAGFINISFTAGFWQNHIAEILRQGTNYGDLHTEDRRKINIEYVSANPTGPMHIGHARGAVVGDALAALLKKAGHDVTKEYYINDAGNQIDALAKSAYLRYREACGEDIGTIPEGLYPGDYLVEVGKELKNKYGNELLSKTENEYLEIVKPFVVDSMMRIIKKDLSEMGVTHDIFTSEKTLHDSKKIDATLEILSSKGLIYKGTLEPPKGKLPDDWEAREQTLFKTTKYGDDIDRPLVKSDGSWTYFAADTAYAKDKIERGFNDLIMVLGADHGGYIKRMKAAVNALSEDEVKLSVILCQLVKFMEDNKPIKMSKRSGNFTTVKDVIDAVGKDVVRFIMLTRKPEQPLDFDIKKVTEQSKNNPVFYVQYAHARACSLLRMAKEEKNVAHAVGLSETPTKEQLKLLNSKAEISLIKQLANWPRIVESAAKSYEPHRIAFYLQDVAAEFHSFWNSGNANPELRFIHSDNVELTSARLALSRSVATVIASGLTILGVTPVKQM